MANIFETLPFYQTLKGASLSIKASALQKVVNKEIEDNNKRREQLLSLANKETDVAKRNIYLQQASLIKDTSLESLEKVISDMPSTKQVLASSAEGATMMVGGSAIKTLLGGGYKALKTGQAAYGVSKIPLIGKLGSEAGQAAKATEVFLDITKAYEAKEKIEQAGKVGKVIQVGKSILHSTAEGAAFGAFGEAAINKEATTSDIAKSAAIVGALGGGLNIVGRGIGAGIEYAGKEISPKIKDAYSFFKNKLDDFSKGKLPEHTAINRIKNTIEKEKNILQKLAGKTVDILSGTENATAKFFDRFDPLKKMEEAMWKAKGFPLEDKDRIYRQVRLLNSKVDDATVREVDAFISKIRKFEKSKDDSVVYLKALDDLDRANNGQLLKVVDGKSVKVTPEEAAKNLQEVIATYTIEGKLDDLEQIRKIWRDQTENELIKMKNAGLISDAEILAMKKAHPNYIPHKVILDTQTKAYIKSSLNVSEDGLKKAIGSIRDIQDPYKALGARIQLLNRKIQQNELLKNVVNAGEKYGIDGFRPIQTAANVKEKRNLLSQLKDKTELNNQIKLLKFDKKIDSKLSSEISKLKKEAISEYNKIAKKIDIDAEDIPEELVRDFEKFNSIIDKIENKIEGSKLANDVISGIKESISGIRKSRKETWMEAMKLSKKDIYPGEQTINLFKDGIRETWVVPEDIAGAIKGTDVIPPSGVLKFVSKVNSIFKQMTTTFNPSFSIPNKFRDEQTAMLTAESFIHEMAKRTGVSAKAVNATKEELVDMWKKSGGIGANVYRDGEEMIFKGLQDTGIMKFVKDPREALSALADMSEQTTRLKVFRMGLERGLSADDAALVARDATIDFAKMGTVMQTLNQVIPFLNARTQGFLNLGTAIKNNPEMFMRTQMLTSVYPTMALEKWNSQWNSYNEISQEIKNKYWIIVVNEVNAKDDNGEDITIPQFLTIPKGEGQVLVSNPIQYYLERARTKDPRSVMKMLVDTVGSASPVEFQNFTERNPLLSALSQFGPMGTLAGGYLSGKDPFFGTDLHEISKEDAYNYLQTTKSTPESLAKLSEIFAMPDENGKPRGISISPSMLNFTINSAGGIPQSLNKLANIIYGVSTGEKPARQKTDTLFGMATQLPITERIMRESYPFYSPEQQAGRARAEEVEREEKSKKVIRTNELEKAAKDFLSAKESGDYSKNELKEYWNNYIVGSYKLTEEEQQGLFEYIGSIMEQTKSGRVGNVSKTQPIEVRGRLIYENYKKIKETEGKEAANKYQEELLKKGILTDSVFEYLTSPDFKK